MHNRDKVLLRLGEYLRDARYQFVTPTPLTVERLRERCAADGACSLRDIFGWNVPFARNAIPEKLFDDLVAETLCAREGDRFRSKIRYSTIGNLLFVHSGFPTRENDSVFFGPDTYRFARAIRELTRLFPRFHPERIADIGTGSGAGGIVAAQAFPSTSHAILSDVNLAALEFCSINIALNGVTSAVTYESDVLKAIKGTFDLIIANPPYLIDERERLYRHGGGDWGCALAIRIVQEGLEKLAPDGKLLLYTGAAIVDGKDMFYETVEPVLRNSRVDFEYDELDPDVFGEELAREPYRRAERIAVIRLLINAPRRRSSIHVA
jgi:methylase of polypeptide subunit release factors